MRPSQMNWQRVLGAASRLQPNRLKGSGEMILHGLPERFVLGRTGSLFLCVERRTEVPKTTGRRKLVPPSPLHTEEEASRSPKHKSLWEPMKRSEERRVGK